MKFSRYSWRAFIEHKKNNQNFLLQPFSSTFKNLWFASIVLFVSQAIVSALSLPNLENTLRLQFIMRPDEVRTFIESWSAEEWAGFWRHYKWDFIHPIVYSYCLLVLAVNLEIEKTRLFRCRILIVAAAIFDYLENIFHILGLRNSDHLVDSWVVAGGFFALSKWSFISITIGLLILDRLRN